MSVRDWFYLKWVISLEKKRKMILQKSLLWYQPIFLTVRSLISYHRKVLHDCLLLTFILTPNMHYFCTSDLALAFGLMWSLNFINIKLGKNVPYNESFLKHFQISFYFHCMHGSIKCNCLKSVNWDAYVLVDGHLLSI